jgi:hypothetical protein
MLACLLGTSLTFAVSQEKKEQPRKPVFTDAKEAGGDFQIQGEYQGTMGLYAMKLGAQVIALGDGKFTVNFLKGGLPGDGWDGRIKDVAEAKTSNGKTLVKGKDLAGEISEGKLTGTAELNPYAPVAGKFDLKRVVRKSPTLGARPPEGAVVLFDGSNADQWENGKLVEGNLLNVGVFSKRAFKDIKRAHVEFRLPFMPQHRGQGRANSGVYMQRNLYEIQVLDSFGLKGENNECGGLYTIKAPAINMCYPPLSWQTYDIEFHAARFNTDGNKTANAVITVLHNGVKIHDRVEIPFSTEDHKRKIEDRAGAIQLQNHGDPVRYRNIWVVPGK